MWPTRVVAVKMVTGAGSERSRRPLQPAPCFRDSLFQPAPQGFLSRALSRIHPEVPVEQGTCDNGKVNAQRLNTMSCKLGVSPAACMWK